MNKVERIACNLNCVLVTFACLDLINPEVASSQYGPPLQNTKGVGPPLVCPTPFQLESIISPQYSGGSTWTDHLEPPQEKPRRAPAQTDKDFRRKDVVRAISASSVLIWPLLPT